MVMHAMINVFVQIPRAPGLTRWHRRCVQRLVTSRFVFCAFYHPLHSQSTSTALHCLVRGATARNTHVLLAIMLSLARFASAGQCAAAHAAFGVAARRTAAVNRSAGVSARPPFHATRSARVSASRWKPPGDGTEDELPTKTTDALIDAMSTASKLSGRDAAEGKATKVLGDGASLAGNLTWEELDEKVNVYPSERKFQAIGEGGDVFVAKIVDVVELALGRPVKPENIAARPSSKGKYVSANVTVTLENGGEVIAVYAGLKACEGVKWYL